ncbi:hypothetical protein L218DRAFT_1008479, partial [Marasmius fiardii PR-910]
MFAKTSLFALVAVAVAGVSACLGEPSGLARRASSDFGYSNGLLLWAFLKPEYQICATGTRQSPINIDGTIPFANSAPAMNIPSVDSATVEIVKYAIQ